MTSSNYLNNQASDTLSDAEKMIKYGIARVPMDYFHYKVFRYSNLADAVAQAEREMSGPHQEKQVGSAAS